MEKKKCRTRDRLSELPDSLLFDIFWLLPMRDVVRTTTLSKRWRNLWTTAPSLNFEDEAQTDTDRARSFINGALMFWRGTRVQKLKIEFSNVTKDLYRDIDLWVCFAKKSKVEDLRLYLRYKYDTYQLDEIYRLPECLYSCSSLVTLDIKGCNLRIPTNNVSWDRLYFVRIDGFELSQDSVNKVLRGSPKLEFLSLTFPENHESLCIEHGGLRWLYIGNYFSFGYENPPTDKELRIWTPRLKTLDVYGIPYARCSMKVPSLTLAYLSLYGPTYYRHDLYSNEDFVREATKQFLPAIQHVKEIALSDWLIKALVSLRKKNILSPFPNVRYLKINGILEEYEEIVHLLEIFPKLERLVLKQVKKLANNRQVGNAKASQHKFGANFPDSFLRELSSISIDWTDGQDSVFPLTEMLLKHASELEKMVFTVKESADSSNSLSLASQKILKMPKSSPTAEIILR